MDKEKHEKDKQQWLKDQGKIIQHGIKKAVEGTQKQHKEECKECFMIPVRELIDDNKILRKQLEQAEELLNIHGITI